MTAATESLESLCVRAVFNGTRPRRDGSSLRRLRPCRPRPVDSRRSSRSPLAPPQCPWTLGDRAPRPPGVRLGRSCTRGCRRGRYGLLRRWSHCSFSARKSAYSSSSRKALISRSALSNSKWTTSVMGWPSSSSQGLFSTTGGGSGAGGGATGRGGGVTGAGGGGVGGGCEPPKRNCTRPYTKRPL